jgi:prepilin-type N-terminal cleavage/methylation domain-containing protein
MRPVTGGRLRDARGFTLIELLVSMTLGLVVIGAALSLVSLSAGASKRVTDRVDATQLGRTALEQTVQRLRGITCPDVVPPVRPIIAAGSYYVFFHGDLDDDRTFDPKQQAVGLVDAGGGRYSLESAVWLNRAPSNVVPDLADPAKTVRVMVERGAPPTLTRPFRFYAVDGTGTGYVAMATDPSGAIPEADIPRIARIDVALDSPPTSASVDPRSTVNLESSVYPRAGRTAAAVLPTFSC